MAHPEGNKKRPGQRRLGPRAARLAPSVSSPRYHPPRGWPMTPVAVRNLLVAAMAMTCGASATQEKSRQEPGLTMSGADDPTVLRQMNYLRDPSSQNLLALCADDASVGDRCLCYGVIFGTYNMYRDLGLPTGHYEPATAGRVPGLKEL